MNVTSAPAGLATEVFDAETLALLADIEVDLPDFGSVDLDVVFGTPLSLYEGGLLPGESIDGLEGLEGDDLKAAIESAVDARESRMYAAADITADDPTIAARVREVLADVLLPYAAQLARPVRPVVLTMAADGLAA